MKKIIGILGVAVIAVAMFFSSNAVNSSMGDLNLASLISLNNANAECGAPPSCSSVCHSNPYFHCVLTCEMNYITCDNTYPN
jgi:hypothetical protein